MSTNNNIASSPVEGELKNDIGTNGLPSPSPQVAPTLPTPYRGVLNERLEPGQTLVVRGITAKDARRFSINLHNKSADFSGNDVPLHMSVRFDQSKIVLNSMVNSEWGKEEHKSCPLKQGHPFDVRIRAHDTKFQIIIDGKEFKEYDYRLPLQLITHFSIDGDLIIHRIHWGGKYYPIPYETAIPQSFGVGKRLNVSGTVKKKGRCFLVNLLHKNGDIALHVNPRFNEKAVIRNSLKDNKWGNEEREGKLPFEKGTCFDLKVANEPTQFSIFVNGQHFTNFAHRSDPCDIYGLQIQGDIELTSLEME